MFILLTNHRYRLEPGREVDRMESNLKDHVVKTPRGYVSMATLNEQVYRKFGYEIVKPTLPVPTVRMIEEPTCDTIFADWLRISQEPQPDEPPKEIPDELLDQFLMYNYSAVKPWYFNEKFTAVQTPRKWNRVGEMMKDPKSFLGYGKEGGSVYNAMRKHRLDGKRGVFIGSLTPWVEVIALFFGAAETLTVEYSPIEIQKEYQNRMSAILPAEFVENWKKYEGTFDFAASFSSIEHSGLGRFGDPIDPIGDLREMLKIKCLLKPGGLLFLGFPLGTDSLQFNAHRIYGSVRLAMIFFGFEWIGTFSGDQYQPIDLNSTLLNSPQGFDHFQHTMVLQKL
ncbi:unnamed protein product [Caenorhabditis sp. 36 PRJEB53466]|nr:unnamed protein product [Caenorhabditis sp. 36 PRJEB53466]